jgi:DNA polymerase-3 subunit beta
MKVICSKENLAEAINIAQKAVSSRSPLPILEGILVEADKNLKLTGNDLELGIECYVDADIKEPGSIVINSRMFGEIVRRLPDSEVLIEVKENETVVIECDNSKFEIKGLPASGFPALPVVEKEKAIKMKQKTVRDMIRQTIFAVSTDENRPILTGTLIECNVNELVFVSCDSYRVAIRRAVVDNLNSEFQLVVPGKTLNEIAKIIEPVDDELDIYSGNNLILFDTGKCKIVSRLLEGQYFKYRTFLQEDAEAKVTVNVKQLLSSIERASLVITAEERRYPVHFNIKNDKMVILSSTDVGNVREELYVEMTGSGMEIYFNPRYFIEALRAIDDEKVEISFTTNVGPCTIRPLEGDSFAYLIVPVRK